MVEIDELLSRRTDLSTFVVHLTRAEGNEDGRMRLESILSSHRIEARTAYGHARKRVENNATALASQQVVCFTETPLEHLHLLIKDIENRQFKLAPYGLAFTKKRVRQLGANPVWYVDMTPGHDWLTVPLDTIVKTAIEAGNFETSNIAKIAPFIEQMGTQPGNYCKEFWWEREWRHRGDFDLPTRFIGLCPEAEAPELSTLAGGLGYQAVWLDPIWGLEEIIGHLAGFTRDEIRVMD